jgi:hypothetical protein
VQIRQSTTIISICLFEGGNIMERYKRGYVMLPVEYGLKILEMNLYQQNKTYNLKEGQVFINWEGEWHIVVYDEKLEMYIFNPQGIIK